MSGRDQAYVARNDINVLVASTVTVDIFINTSNFADDLQDRFQLTSEDGAYDRTLARGQALRHDLRTLVVRFTRVLPGRRYSLFHYPAEAAKVPVFTDVPFASLDEYGSVTPEPRSRNAAKAPRGSPPRLNSRDPVLLDPADSTDDVASRHSEPPSGGTPAR